MRDMLGKQIMHNNKPADVYMETDKHYFVEQDMKCFVVKKNGQPEVDSLQAAYINAKVAKNNGNDITYRFWCKKLGTAFMAKYA